MNTLRSSKHNKGALGVFTRTGGTIGVFGELYMSSGRHLQAREIRLMQEPSTFSRNWFHLHIR